MFKDFFSEGGSTIDTVDLNAHFHEKLHDRTPYVHKVYTKLQVCSSARMAETGSYTRSNLLSFFSDDQIF